MNKRRTIYKGFNKKRKRKEIKVIAILLSVGLIGWYGYTNLKNNSFISNIKGKLSSFNIVSKIDKLIPDGNKVEEFTYDDVSEEVDKIKETSENQELNNEDIKLVQIEGWDIYTVQVASVENNNDLNKVESVLKENKIPYSVLEIDNVKKIQTYGSFEKEDVRVYLDEIRTLYQDAFLSQVKIPMLSLEYTNKYSYVEDISKDINKLIVNFEEESKFWNNSSESIDLATYNNILTNRKDIINGLHINAQKIDYEGMIGFKNNLITYAKDILSKVEEASKSANEQNYYISQGLFLSSMQGYLEFINSMKQV